MKTFRRGKRARRWERRQIDGLKIVGEISRLRLEPGDIVVLSTALALTPEQVSYLRAALTDHLAEVGLKNRCVLLTAGLTMNVIRPELAAA